MGRKKNETTLELRKLVIFHHNEGKKLKEISEIVQRSISTIQYIIRRYKEENRIENAPRNTNRKKLNEPDNRYIMREIRKNPRISAPKMAVKVETELGKSVSAETIRRTIRNAGYNGRVARRKPLISEKNRKLRLKFVKGYRNRTFDFWKNVLFTDESKYNVFGSDGRQLIWRKPNEELKKQNLQPTVKYGGGSVMVWGCFSAAGVGKLHFIDGIMNKTMYINILRTSLPESTARLGIKDCFVFYQDNDPKHKAYDTRQWLLYNCPKVIETPPQSPDINPIENLWHELEIRIRKHAITNKEVLKRVLEREWYKIEPKVCEKLVRSLPNRLEEVRKNKGYPTKY